jgi:hypothetical protein
VENVYKITKGERFTPKEMGNVPWSWLSPEGCNEGIANTAIVPGLIEDFPPGTNGVEYPERLSPQNGEKALGVARRVIVSESSGIRRTRKK